MKYSVLIGGNEKNFRLVERARDSYETARSQGLPVALFRGTACVRCANGHSFPTGGPAWDLYIAELQTAILFPGTS